MKQEVKISIRDNNLKRLVKKVLKRIPEKLPPIYVFISKYDAKDKTDGEVDENNDVLLDPKILINGEDYVIGVIAHEFAHAYLQHGLLGRSFEDKNRGNVFAEMDADLLACKWGFEKEIRIVRGDFIREFKKSYEEHEKIFPFSLKPKFKKKQDKWFKLVE